MIYTNSVLRGYTSQMGFLFSNLSYFGASFSILKNFPSEEQFSVYDLDNMGTLYTLQQLFHFTAILIALMNMNVSVWKHMETVAEFVSSVTVLLMITIYMFQWQTMLRLADE